MPVLVVDDAPEVREVVRAALAREDIEVVEAADGAEALARARESRPLIAVLDLDLPDMSGVDLLGELREFLPSLHVIMLTAAGGEDERVLALSRGADDYVVKPFSHRELVARVLSARRRLQAQSTSALVHGGLRIDTDVHEVTVDGRRIELTPKEFDLLAFLVARPRCTFSRDQLLQEVWASSSEWQGSATVTEHVRRLRSKIEVSPEDPEHLVTVRGVGYRFEPGVQPAGVEGRAHPDLEQRQLATVIYTGSTIRHVNSAAAELLGVAEGDALVGREVFELVAPVSMRAAIRRRADADAGRWHPPEPIWFRRSDGSTVLIEVASSPVLWEGEPATQASLWTLAGSAAQVREALIGVRTNVADAVIVTDTNLVIRSFNPAAEELYGWREDEVVGQSMPEVIGPAGRGGGALLEARQHLAEEDGWRGAIEQRRRDGTMIEVRASATVVRGGEGQDVGTIWVNRPRQRGMGSGSSLLLSEAHGSVLDEELELALERQELVVHYQPVVDLATGAVTGVEALVRWQHPDQGLLMPASFVMAAERTGQIVRLGQHVLEMACRQAQRWRQTGDDVHLSVNVSPRQLADEGLPALVEGVMAATSMPRGRLSLEVTESTLVGDIELATAVLHQVSALGVGISVDDFGTGWASLTYLREFPVDALKIDRSFVRGLAGGASDVAIVRSIVSLGRELELSVIAEGVETEEQRAELLRLGCRTGQGYLFGHPVPADEVVL